MSCGNRAKLSGKSGGNGKSGTDSRRVPALGKSAFFSHKWKKRTTAGEDYVMYYLKSQDKNCERYGEILIPSAAQASLKASAGVFQPKEAR